VIGGGRPARCACLLSAGACACLLSDPSGCWRGAGGHVTAWAPAASEDKAPVLAFPGDPGDETWGCLQRFQNSEANRPILFGVRVFLSRQGFRRRHFAILIAVVVNHS
jgi:hypothetical protein